jgi:hypothetical protein
MTYSSVGGFGGRRACLRRVARNCSPYCRTIAAAGFNPDADGAPVIDEGALGGNSFNDILA